MFHKHINIFLSSTFRDMQAERDYIKKNVIPRLQADLTPFGITISVTDLRWGIDTTNEEEFEREAKVLRVCMDTIRNGRPYFVGLVGGRYGWIPPKERVDKMLEALPDSRLLKGCDTCSVTEMEMMYGALADPEILPHSFFFIRKSDVYKDIPQEYRSHYVEDDIYRNNKLVELKEKIKRISLKYGESDNIYHYDTLWDGRKKRLTGFEKFGKALYKALYDDIVQYNSENFAITEEDYEERVLQSFVIQNLNGFRGRKGVLTKLTRYLKEFDATAYNTVNGYFLTGFSGCGKSSVFCKILDILRSEKDDKVIILAHSAGLTINSCSPKRMLKRWICQLETKLDNPPKEHSHAIDDFKNLLVKAVSRGYKPVILIDSYDSFDFTDAYHEADSYRYFHFIPANVPFICTCVPGYVDDVVNSNLLFHKVEMDNFNYDEALDLVNFTLQSSVKELGRNLIDKLLSKIRPDGIPSYSSPLWFRLSLSILDEIGDNDFQQINKEQFEREDMKIVSYLDKLIEGFETDPEGLFKQFIDLTCRYFPEKLVKIAVIFSSASSSGISEEEIARICMEEWDELEFASLTHWLRLFFRKNVITGRWSMSHNILRKVLESYEIDFANSYRKRYIEVLLESSDNEAFNELFYQIILDNRAEMLEVLCDKQYGVTTKSLNSIANRLLLNGLNREAYKQFICRCVGLYLSDRYLFEELYMMICDSTDNLVNGGEFQAELLEAAIACFSNDSFSDVSIFKNYVGLINEIISNMSSANKCDAVDHYYGQMIDIYHRNRELYGTDVTKDDSLLKSLLMVMSYFKTVPVHLRNIHTYSDQRWEEFKEDAFRRHQIITREIDYIISLDESVVSKYGEEIVDLYLSGLKYWNFPDGQSAVIEEYAGRLQIDSTLFDEALGRAPIVYEDNWSEYLDSYKRRDDDPFKKRDNTPNDVAKLLGQIDSYIAENIKNQYEDEYGPIADLYIKAADIYVEKGCLEQARSLILTCKGLLLNHISQIPILYYRKPYNTDSGVYRVAKRHMEPIKAILEWLAGNNSFDAAVESLEDTYSIMRLWVAFNPVSDMKMIVDMLYNCYVNTGMLDKAERLLHEITLFILHYPIPSINIRSNYHVRDYRALLKKTGRSADNLESMINDWQLSDCEEIEDVDNNLVVRRFKTPPYAIAVQGKYKYSEKWGFSDEDGSILITPRFDAVSCFSEGLAMVGIGNPDKSSIFGSVGMKYGFIDIDGDVAIDLKYDYASAFYKGRALVCEKGEFFYIDKYGNVINPL